MGAGLDVAPTVAVDAEKSSRPITWAGLKYGASNLALAVTFLCAALPSAARYRSGAANLIWISGAMIMGALSLVRVPPRVSRVDIRAISATIGMLVFPVLMRPGRGSTGALNAVAIAVELTGMSLSQVARIYMGRSFGLFPANRGVVIRGPFRLVRHPVYLGWLLLTIGFGLAYPTLVNWWLLLGAIPFLLWRIRLEEALLADDPEYREYRSRVRYQLIPGLV